jgi:hypothetical protein
MMIVERGPLHPLERATILVDLVVVAAPACDAARAPPLRTLGVRDAVQRLAELSNLELQGVLRGEAVGRKLRLRSSPRLEVGMC